MLQVYKYIFGENYWNQNWMWQYSNPNLTLSDPKYLYFQTPVSGTINLTLTNNTGSAISNTTSTSTTIPTTVRTTTSISTTTWRVASQSTYRTLYFGAIGNTTYTFTNNTSNAIVCGYTTSTNFPTTTSSIPLNGVTTINANSSVTKSTTNNVRWVFGYSTQTTPNMSTTDVTVTENYVINTLTIIDDLYNTINVDLGQNTLAVNETITVPITLPSSTNRLYFYNNTGGAAIEGYWPQISLPYTGWSVRNLSDGFIKYRSNGSWT